MHFELNSAFLANLEILLLFPTSKNYDQLKIEGPVFCKLQNKAVNMWARGGNVWTVAVWETSRWLLSTSNPGTQEAVWGLWEATPRLRTKTPVSLN